jgi:hypothetical protein
MMRGVGVGVGEDGAIVDLLVRQDTHHDGPVRHGVPDGHLVLPLVYAREAPELSERDELREPRVASEGDEEAAAREVVHVDAAVAAADGEDRGHAGLRPTIHGKAADLLRGAGRGGGGAGGLARARARPARRRRGRRRGVGRGGRGEEDSQARARGQREGAHDPVAVAREEDCARDEAHGRGLHGPVVVVARAPAPGARPSGGGKGARGPHRRRGARRGGGRGEAGRDVGLRGGANRLELAAGGKGVGCCERGEVGGTSGEIASHTADAPQRRRVVEHRLAPVGAHSHHEAQQRLCAHVGTVHEPRLALHAQLAVACKRGGEECRGAPAQKCWVRGQCFPSKRGCAQHTHGPRPAHL